MDVLARGESWTRVRTADGKTGWIPAGYLETEPPPTLRLAQLETETESLRTQLGAEGFGFGFELREAKGRRRLGFEVAGGNPTGLAIGGSHAGPAFAAREDVHLVAGFDRAQNLELGARTGAEIETDIAPNPSNVGCGDACEAERRDDEEGGQGETGLTSCLLYTSPSPRDFG